jgi:hypothetical protein
MGGAFAGVCLVDLLGALALRRMAAAAATAAAAADSARRTDTNGLLCSGAAALPDIVMACYLFNPQVGARVPWCTVHAPARPPGHLQTLPSCTSFVQSDPTPPPPPVALMAGLGLLSVQVFGPCVAGASASYNSAAVLLSLAAALEGAPSPPPPKDCHPQLTSAQAAAVLCPSLRGLRGVLRGSGGGAARCRAPMDGAGQPRFRHLPVCVPDDAASASHSHARSRGYLVGDKGCFYCRCAGRGAGLATRRRATGCRCCADAGYVLYRAASAATDELR